MCMNRTYLLLLMLSLVQGCSEESLSPEEQIKQTIEQAVEAAENRSAADLGELIDEKYLDQRGLHKKKLTDLIRLMFFKHKNIFLFTRIESIDFPSANVANATVQVAMAGSIISDVNALASLRAKMYTFELVLIKTDEQWLLQQASWKRAALVDMQ
jgi:hypothetical protein